MYGWIVDYVGNESACKVNNELHRIIRRECKRMESSTGNFCEDWLWDSAKEALKECWMDGELDMEYVEDAITNDADNYIDACKEA